VTEVVTAPAPPLPCVVEVEAPTPGRIVSATVEQVSVPATEPKSPRSDSWVDLVKGSSKKLSKKGSGFTFPSGELCIEIPNAVIERNKKSWDSFILGQFYSDPPSQGTLHNIVNGIWSR